MAGYYLQSRSLPLVTISEQFGEVKPIVNTKSAVQTTYSYRSSQPKNAEEQTYSDLLRPGWVPAIGTSDIGHEFYTRKASAFFGSRGRFDNETRCTTLNPIARWSPGWNRMLVSSFLTNAESVFLQPDLQRQLLYPGLMSENDKIFYGKKALVAAAPNRPEASLMTFFAEFLQDGLPSGILSSIGRGQFKGYVSEARKLGGDYLNVQFGWAPLVRDFISLLNVVINSYSIIEQYRRDSGGKGVRRRRTVLKETTTKDYTSSFGLPFSEFGNGINSFGDDGYYDPLSGAYAGSKSSVQLSTTTEVAFSGKFQYYIPKSNDLDSKLERYASYAQKLLGVKITPDVLWNAAPWSWLLDWFADIGTSVELTTLLQSDDLVINYGYLMKKTTKRFSFNLEAGKGYNVLSPALSSVIIGTQKERYRATPFGFGWDPSTASNTQLAIVAALLSGDRSVRAR